ncbi:hypothetical protein MJC1_00720 [Methylocystis sp. MJC1]|jgi:hypothetical protein|nr:hypothetical protein MJC1_00720 [Methylocystis sp. MJC1]
MRRLRSAGAFPFGTRAACRGHENYAQPLRGIAPMQPPHEGEGTAGGAGLPHGTRVVAPRLTDPAGAADPDGAPASWRGGSEHKGGLERGDKLGGEIFDEERNHPTSPRAQRGERLGEGPGGLVETRNATRRMGFLHAARAPAPAPHLTSPRIARLKTGVFDALRGGRTAQNKTARASRRRAAKNSLLSRKDYSLAALGLVSTRSAMRADLPRRSRR